MIGMLEYVCEVDTPLRTPYKAVDFYAALAMGNVAPAGSTIQILLDHRYTKFDDKIQANVSREVSDFGYVEITAHAIREGDDFSIDWVEHTREAGMASDYDAFMAFVKFHIAGVAKWTPDVDFPDEVYDVIANKIPQPKRARNQFLFGFDFSFNYIPAAQAQYIAPAIVAPSAI